MLNNIGWGDFRTAVLLFLVLYYAYVLLRYYRKDFQFRSGIGKAVLLPGKDSMNENLLSTVQGIADELSAYVEQAGREKATRNEMIAGLRNIIRKYPAVNNSSYTGIINHLIQYDKNNKRIFHLSDEELGQVWMG